jgi:hypothetical protein
VFEGPEAFVWEAAVRVYLPPEQTVIACPLPAGLAGICPWISGPMIKNTEHVGVFTTIDGKLERRATVSLSPLALGNAQMRVGAEVDGRHFRNLDWGS